MILLHCAFRSVPWLLDPGGCQYDVERLSFDWELHDSSVVKGSVERSLLPWAIFLIFTRNRSWKSEDYLCTLFFIEMSKERLEKSKRTLPVSWRPWALAYSPDRPYNFSCLSAVSKRRRFGSFFSASAIFKKEPDQRMKFRKTNKVRKFEVKKVKNKGAVSKNVVRVATCPCSP